MVGNEFSLSPGGDRNFTFNNNFIDEFTGIVLIEERIVVFHE